MQTFFNEDFNIDSSVGLTFPTLELIYKLSKIDWDPLMESLMVISYKSSNSMRDLMSQPYYMTNIMLNKLDKLIKAENGENNNDEQTSYHTQLDKFNEMQKSSMGNMTNMMKSASKMNLPKK